MLVADYHRHRGILSARSHWKTITQAGYKIPLSIDCIHGVSAYYDALDASGCLRRCPKAGGHKLQNPPVTTGCINNTLMRSDLCEGCGWRVWLTGVVDGCGWNCRRADSVNNAPRKASAALRFPGRYGHDWVTQSDGLCLDCGGSLTRRP